MKPEFQITSITILVANLAKSIAFYERVGLPIPPGQHPEDHIVIELQNNLDIVLQQRSQRENNPQESSGMILNILVDQNEEVDSIVKNAIVNGGKSVQLDQTQENDGVYAKYFKDPDGHTWEVSSYFDYNPKLAWAYD
jgi:predicted lactoylglutathione lyase